jgi:hypothetical protein
MSGAWRTLSGGRKVFIPNANPTTQVVTSRRSSLVPNIKLDPNIYKEESGFTTPNASCPICDANVYFYHHPNGARVFFDELGPPWPLHPCTDNGSQPTKKGNKPKSWQKSGWNPLFIDKYVELVNGSTIRVQASNQGGTFRFEVEKKQLKKNNILVDNLDTLLIQCLKSVSSKAKIQLHNGSSYIELYAERVKNPSKMSRIQTPEKKKTAKNLFVEGNVSLPFEKLNKVDKPIFEIKTDTLLVECEVNKYKYSARCKSKEFKKVGFDINKLELYSYMTKKKSLMLYIVNTNSKEYFVKPAVSIKEDVSDKVLGSSVIEPHKSSSLEKFELSQVTVDTTVSEDYWLLKGIKGTKLFCGLLDKKSKRFDTLVKLFAAENFSVLIEPLKNEQGWFGLYNMYINESFNSQIFNIPDMNLLDYKKMYTKENIEKSTEMLASGKNPELVSKLIEAYSQNS